MATSYLLTQSRVATLLLGLIAIRNLTHLQSVSPSPLQSVRLVGSPLDCMGDIKKPRRLSLGFNFVDGNFLSSHTVSSTILSAFVSLTFVFDMGTSGSSQLLSPPWLIVTKYNHNYIFSSARISHFLNSGDQALDLLVSVRYKYYYSSTPDLSTS